MLHFYRQIAVHFFVALATVALAVPTLFAAPCACSDKKAEVKQAVPPCCVQRLAAQNCDSHPTTSEDCCSGTGPCNCPGCKCAVQAPSAIAISSAVAPIDPTVQALPVAFLSDACTTDLQQVSRLAHAQHKLAKSTPIPLRALYCVWII